MSLALRLKGRSGRGGAGGVRARGTDESQVCSRRLAWPGPQPPVRDRVPRPARSLLTERGVGAGLSEPHGAGAGAASGRGDRTAVTTVPARTVSLPACLRAPRIQRGDGVHACDNSGQLSNAALSQGLAKSDVKSDVYDRLAAAVRGRGVVPRGGRGPRAHGGRRPSHEDTAQGPSHCPCSGFVLSHREVPGDLLI